MKNIIIFITAMVIITGCSKTSENMQKTNIVKVQNKPIVLEQPIFLKEKVNEVIPFIPDVVIEEEKTYETLSIIFSSKNIGKYALEATNSITTYLLNKDDKFSLKVYDLEVQNKENLENVISQIKNAKIKKVIAMITKEELSTLSNISGTEDIQFYFPLINKFDITNVKELNNANYIFGAISYKKQFNTLIKYASSNNLVEFYGNSGIGKVLHSYLKNEDIKYTKKIDNNNGSYKYFLEDNSKLNNSVLLLNTPIVKSSILLSAINAQELTISSILSTQLNYSPLLFSLTQKQDRKKLIIASSIGNIPEELEEYNTLIGNNLSYSWVNYSTIVGVEYLLNNNIDIFKDLSLVNNQVEFPVRLYKVGNSSFSLIK